MPELGGRQRDEGEQREQAGRGAGDGPVGPLALCLDAHAGTGLSPQMAKVELRSCFAVSTDHINHFAAGQQAERCKLPNLFTQGCNFFCLKERTSR